MGLGFGFPAARGGLMRWVATEGTDRVVAALDRWAAEADGPDAAARYVPADWLRRRTTPTSDPRPA